jgi:hypothetical protein
MRTRNLCGITLSVVLGIAAAVQTQSAGAAVPTVTPIHRTSSFPVTDLCSFPVDFTAVQNGSERTLSTHHGTVTRLVIHTVEQDTFTANGHTLAGTPFVNETHVTLDSNGDVVHAYEMGVIERVPLPDGTTFHSAGRVDFLAHPDASILVVPDVGHAGNLAGLCDALSA